MSIDFDLNPPYQKHIMLLKNVTNVRKSFVQTAKKQGSNRFLMYRVKDGAAKVGASVNDRWFDYTAISRTKDKSTVENHRLGSSFLETIEMA